MQIFRFKKIRLGQHVHVHVVSSSIHIRITIFRRGCVSSYYTCTVTLGRLGTRALQDKGIHNISQQVGQLQY